MKVTLSNSNIAGALVAAFCGIVLGLALSVGIIAYYVRPKETTWTVRHLCNTLRKRVDLALNDRNAHFNNVAYNAGTCVTLHGSKTDSDDSSHGKCGEPPSKHIKLPEFDGLGFGENGIVAPPANHTEFTHVFATSVTTGLDFSNNDDTVPGSPGGDRHEFDFTAPTVSAIDTQLDNSGHILCGELSPATTSAKISEHDKLQKNGRLCPIVSTPQPRAPKYDISRNKTIRVSGSTCAYVADKDSHPSVHQTSQASTGDEEQYHDIVEGLPDLVSYLFHFEFN